MLKKPILLPPYCIFITASPNATAIMCLIKTILGISEQDIGGAVWCSHI